MSSSIVAKEAIEVIAQSIGITNLSPDVSQTLAPDVEYRLREIIQEAIKCMRHSRRTALTAHDVDTALILRNVEVSSLPPSLPSLPLSLLLIQ